MKEATLFAKILVIALMASLLAFSCRKSSSSDDDDTEYVGGTITYVLPAYTAPGDSYELVPTGAYTSDGSDIGFCWTLSTDTSIRDTTRHIGDPPEVTGAYTLNIPEDFVGDLTVTCYAFADGYYTRTQSSTTTVVDSEKSLVISKPLEPAESLFYDERDGRLYTYLAIGDLDWFTQNLAYESGKPFYNVEAMRDIFGAFYTWNEAKTACPEGWRLPDSEDWLSLATALGCEAPETLEPCSGIAGAMMAKAFFNDNEMWEFNANVKLTNSSVFSALPVGYANVVDEKFVFAGFYNYSVFWTASEFSDNKALYRFLYKTSPDVMVDAGYKEYFAAQVRCVRNAE